MSNSAAAAVPGIATQVRFLSLRDVEYLTSLKKSTIYNLIREGEFPAQSSLTPRRRGWLASDVEHWIQLRANAANPREAA